MNSRTGFAAPAPDAERLPLWVAYPLIGFLACCAWGAIAFAILYVCGLI